MTQVHSRSWRLNRQINLSVIMQVILLASLIVGSWINLQRQLDLLQRDVGMLLQSQNNLEQRIESLWTKSIAHEYRLQAIEKQTASSDKSLQAFRLPYHAAALARFAVVAEDTPDLRRFSAQADGSLLVEAANCLD